MADILLIILILIFVVIIISYIIYWIINIKSSRIEISPYANKVENLSGKCSEYSEGRELYHSISNDKRTVLEVFLPTGLAPDLESLEKMKDIKPVKICLPIEKRQVLAPGERGQLGRVILYPLNYSDVKRLKINDNKIDNNPLMEKMIKDVQDQNVYDTFMTAQTEETKRIKELTERHAGGEMTDMAISGIMDLAKELLKLRPEESKKEEKKEGESKK